MDYLTAREASELWGITQRRVQALCENGQVFNAERLGTIWVIPKGTPKPPDGRRNNSRKKITAKPNLGKE